jgi:hypothetical protein
MNDQTKIDQDRAERTEKLQGMGCKRKRVEDVRFTQGKGSYVDDLKLPGMLFGDFVRSPLCPCAHQEHRHQPRQGLAGRRRGADRRRPQAARPALDADAGW